MTRTRGGRSEVTARGLRKGTDRESRIMEKEKGARGKEDKGVTSLPRVA